MTDKQMTEKIAAISEEAKSDIHYNLYNQAEAAREALIADIEAGSPTAGNDTIEIIIGGKNYPIGAWSADVCSLIFDFIYGVKNVAVEELNK